MISKTLNVAQNLIICYLICGVHTLHHTLESILCSFQFLAELKTIAVEQGLKVSVSPLGFRLNHYIISHVTFESK